ncbi:MAG: hypothetical protein U9Q99_02815, partial [Nanoarchaeota archaeon]|nr:hypothetical protein [Nanoarchaeota archaeon]
EIFMNIAKFPYEKIISTNAEIKKETSEEKDYWTIPNVEYNGKIISRDLKKELLPSNNQEGHLEDALKAGETGFKIMDKDLEYAITKAAYFMKKSKEKKEIRSFLKESFYNYYLVSGTSVFYNPEGEKDIVKHKVRDESIKVNAIGPNEKVIDSKTKEFYKALLGENDLQIANDVYKWVTREDLYSWRLDSKQSQTIEGVVKSNSNSDRFDLFACGIPASRYRCFGGRESQTK